MPLDDFTIDQEEGNILTYKNASHSTSITKTRLMSSRKSKIDKEILWELQRLTTPFQLSSDEFVDKLFKLPPSTLRQLYKLPQEELMRSLFIYWKYLNSIHYPPPQTLSSSSDEEEGKNGRKRGSYNDLFEEISGRSDSESSLDFERIEENEEGDADEAEFMFLNGADEEGAELNVFEKGKHDRNDDGVMYRRSVKYSLIENERTSESETDSELKKIVVEKPVDDNRPLNTNQFQNLLSMITSWLGGLISNK